VQLIVIVKLMEDIRLCYGSVERIIQFQSNKNYILNQIHVSDYINVSPSGLVYKTMIYNCISLLSALYNRLFNGLIN
jgi:hypothetical protein